VALGWLWGAYQLPINRLCGGFEVALGGFARPFARKNPIVRGFSISAFGLKGVQYAAQCLLAPREHWPLRLSKGI
jgi:hypothetical protein